MTAHTPNPFDRWPPATLIALAAILTLGACLAARHDIILACAAAWICVLLIRCAVGNIAMDWREK